MFCTCDNMFEWVLLLSPAPHSKDSCVSPAPPFLPPESTLLVAARMIYLKGESGYLTPRLKTSSSFHHIEHNPVSRKTFRGYTVRPWYLFTVTSFCSALYLSTPQLLWPPCSSLGRPHGPPPQGLCTCFFLSWTVLPGSHERTWLTSLCCTDFCSDGTSLKAQLTHVKLPSILHIHPLTLFYLP